MTPNQICETYQRSVAAGDEDAWLKVWSADLPKLIVASPGGTELHCGIEDVRKLIFGAKEIVGNPTFSDSHIYLTDDSTKFFWRVHIDFRPKDGATFDNDLLIEMTLDETNGKIKIFREFADHVRRDRLIAYIASKRGQST
jgi:hypothetical protein